MKKILITFALLLTTLLTFGQDSPYYVRGISFELGYKDLKSNINWDDTSYKDCNILIKLTENDITIYSQTKQQYRVINFNGKTSNGFNRWYCSNSEGKTCYIYLNKVKDSPGYLSLTVEFSDLIWFYICKPSE